MYGMTKTTIYLPDELKRQIEEAAERERRSEAEIIREALAKAMRERTPPKPTVPLFEEGLGDPTIAERVDELIGDDFDR
jgi:Arc/MetJ-type ribon-helix-helix transcriptional regulator